MIKGLIAIVAILLSTTAIMFAYDRSNREMLLIHSERDILEKPIPMFYRNADNRKIGTIAAGQEIESVYRVYGKDYLFYKVRYGEGYGYIMHYGKEVESKG